ncbi:MAG: arsenate reductase ArsC [Sedimentisphaerales bacterium]|nr:arsenate reductase ArsC [Sedimentisphaerales bacterium]
MRTADKLKILFLCTGNSCRSQMAEGWARHLKADVIEAFSAGVCPVGVSQRAAEVMAQAGVDISKHYSKHVKDFAGIDFDYVVTVCDNAKEQCPIFPGKCKMIHRNFEDPSFMTGTEEQIMEAFRKTRDEIRTFIESMPESLQKGNI